jgi:hypothetical protein
MQQSMYCIALHWREGGSKQAMEGDEAMEAVGDGGNKRRRRQQQSKRMQQTNKTSKRTSETIINRTRNM